MEKTQNKLLKNIKNGLKVFGATTLCALTMNCASTKSLMLDQKSMINFYSETGHNHPSKYAEIIIEESGIECQEPIVVYGKDEQNENVTFMNTFYADGSSDQAKFEKLLNGGSKVSSKSDLNSDHEYTGLCNKIKDMDIAGDGFIVDEVSKQKLMSIAARENKQLKENIDIKVSETDNPKTTVITTLYTGNIYGGLSGFEKSFLNNICKKIDSDSNMILTSFECDKYNINKYKQRKF
ncbi:hypothetical protein CMO90_04190 [Candidatus Woesearchaeota archaeon]|jgi:hypothetical protein|nr:hypothetical protein [Candidatus Woesearchaeota archaeon]|tara:strand:- start:74 stop:784 length:711 start_codon:yes stop_codon:yes gene_type:complete